MSLFKDCDPLSIKDVRVGGKVVWTRERYLIDGLRALPEEERLDILSNFCKGCGDYDPEHNCFCQVDE